MHCDCGAEPGSLVHDEDCATLQGPADDPYDHYRQ